MRKQAQFITLVLVFAVGLVGLTTSPAMAYADVAVGQSPSGLIISGECTATPVATTDLVTVEYAVKATGHAAGAVTTLVECIVREGGQVIGGCEAALPGPFAPCVGRATGMLHGTPRVCVKTTGYYVADPPTSTRSCN